MTGWSGPGASISKFPHRDKAETFAESDVTLTHSDTVVDSGSLSLFNGTYTTRPDDTSSFSDTEGRGVRINPNTDLGGVKVQISVNTGAVNEVFIQDGGGTILDRDQSGHTGGDVVHLEASLSAGTNYDIGVYDGGASYTYGSNTSVSFPYGGTDLDQTDGLSSFTPGTGGASTSGSTANGIGDVAGLGASSGSVTVEWPNPSDVFAWGHATFQRTPDGETATIDVEETSDGGSTWNVVATDITRGADISAAASGNNVRLVANLSRASTANNPTVDFLARSYTQ